MPASSPAPTMGITCPKCDGIKLVAVATRRMSSRMIRVRRCVRCGHCVRTREVVESVACPPPRSLKRAG